MLFVHEPCSWALNTNYSFLLKNLQEEKYDGNKKSGQYSEQ